MASPCCSKCSKTHFTRFDSTALKVSLIYCSHCGSVVGIAPIYVSATGNEVTLRS